MSNKVNIKGENCKRIQNSKGAVLTYIITLKRVGLHQPEVCSMSDVTLSCLLPA